MDEDDNGKFRLREVECYQAWAIMGVLCKPEDNICPCFIFSQLVNKQRWLNAGPTAVDVGPAFCNVVAMSDVSSTISENKKLLMIRPVGISPLRIRLILAPVY